MADEPRTGSAEDPGTSELPVADGADQPAPGPPVPTPGPDAASSAAPAVPRQAFRERLWTWRGMLAVAVASLIVGGGIGTGITAVATSGHDHRFGPRFERGHSFPPFPGGPGRFGWRGPGGAGPGLGPRQRVEPGQPQQAPSTGPTSGSSPSSSS